MRTVQVEILPKLPADVASLVSQGIYSLFELEESTARYLLTTPHPTEFYLLDEEGGVTVDPSITSIGDARRGAAISLTLPDPPKVNFGSYAMRVAR